MRHIMRENIQREHITKRWKAAGMQSDDIGIICDVDEVYTRDFLLALQSCDVPQFRPGQDCYRPQVTGQALVFEGSSECQFGKRGMSGFFKHPNAVIGECIDGIGDIGVHPPNLRYYPESEESHLLGSRNFDKQPDDMLYPLWKPWDFRNSPDGENLALEDGRLHTAYHFHNFYDSFDTHRNKYKTYGHPIEDADRKPLAQLNKATEDMLKCLKGVRGKYRSFEEIEGRRPVLFEDESYRDARQKEMIEDLEADEERFGTNVFPSR